MADAPYGQRFPQVLIDNRAKREPTRLFALLPRSEKLEDGWLEFTYAAMSEAVDRTCLWLNEQLGEVPEHADFPAVAYIGANDLRYGLLLLACLKTHRQLLVPMMYNTTEAQCRLLDQAKCNTIISCDGYMHFWDSVRAAQPNLHVLQVPEQHDLIHGPEPAQRFPYTKPYAAGKDDPFFIIQSSGTTGNPKILPRSLRCTLDMDASFGYSLTAPPELKEVACTLTKDSYHINPLPQSWAVGLLYVCTFNIWYDQVLIMLPTSAPSPMTAAYMDRVHQLVPKFSKMTTMMVPTVLRDLALNPTYSANLKFYSSVLFGGAPLVEPAGDALVAAGIRVQSAIGSTDTGTYPLLMNDAADWNIHRFMPPGHPFSLGFDMEHFVDDMYELVIHRCGVDDPRPVFMLSPGLEVHRTKDLWQKVQGKKDCYKMVGRVDDFVKLASMTKFNAVEIERQIDASDLVKGSLVGGDARTRSFVLVEPAEGLVEGGLQGLSNGHGDAAKMNGNGDARQSLKDKIWPAVDAANKGVFHEAWLSKELLVLTKPEKPIKRTAKGTVDRRNTLAMYEQEIEEAYRALEEGQ